MAGRASPAGSDMRASGRVVALGGGTGLPGVLEALKPCPPNQDCVELSAIVTVTDDGGSSGRLRRDLGTLPPGDLRNCLVALSEAPDVLRDLFQYRFSQGELEGHSFGNLFIAALAEVTGDFAEALRRLHDILAIRGRIYPSTLASVQLLAERVDGSVALGEGAIPVPGKAIRRVRLEPPDCPALPDACRVLREADLVVLGPGSLFTSVIPNLLLRELAEALRASSARKVYVCNITTQPGETDGLAASQHVKALYDHVGPWACDTVLCNDRPLPEEVRYRYEQEGALPVAVDRQELQDLGCRVIAQDLLAEGDLARHDPLKLGRALHSLVFSPAEVS